MPAAVAKGKIGALADTMLEQHRNLRIVLRFVAEFRARPGEAGVQQQIEHGGAVDQVELLLDPEAAQVGSHRMIGPRHRELERGDRRMPAEAATGDRGEVRVVVGAIDFPVVCEAKHSIGAEEREPAPARLLPHGRRMIFDWNHDPAFVWSPSGAHSWFIGGSACRMADFSVAQQVRRPPPRRADS